MEGVEFVENRVVECGFFIVNLGSRVGWSFQIIFDVRYEAGFHGRKESKKMQGR